MNINGTTYVALEPHGAHAGLPLNDIETTTINGTAYATQEAIDYLLEKKRAYDNVMAYAAQREALTDEDFEEANSAFVLVSSPVGVWCGYTCEHEKERVVLQNARPIYGEGFSIVEVACTGKNNEEQGSITVGDVIETLALHRVMATFVCTEEARKVLTGNA